MDSGSYKISPAFPIKIQPKSKLTIIAAGWPQLEFLKGAETTASEKPLDYLVPDDVRPHVEGDFAVQGTAKSDMEAGGVLVLDGLLIEGRLLLREGNLSGLEMYHCTLVPDNGGISHDFLGEKAEKLNSQLEIKIDHCICGPISLPESIPSLMIMDSIIGNISGAALTVKGTDLEMERCTTYGYVQARSLEASDCIFTDRTFIERTQFGCVRFSYLPPGSRTARKYRCQPDMALENAASPGEEASIRARVAPAFVSGHYDHLGYGQLSQTSVDEIQMGSQDGSEMGAFSSLKNPQREDSLRSSLNEYMRLGLEAGLFRVI
ncbi:Uncharacterised protein [uncultured archaeon]|nr:Uncharacterised protein [uncultured archaeon]